MGMSAKDARHLAAVQKTKNQLDKKKASFGKLGERPDRTPYGSLRSGGAGLKQGRGKR